MVERRWFAVTALMLGACSDYDLHKPADDVIVPDDTTRPDDTVPTDSGSVTDTGSPAAPDEGFVPGETTGPPLGRVVTILLTLHDGYVPDATAAELIVNSVNYVWPDGDAKVLIVRDDETGGEDDDDPDKMKEDLEAAGFKVKLIDEPEDGIDVAALAGYHVAILSNPGHPPDDHATIDAFRDFSSEGYGIIFQGDDMTRFADDSDAMQELTRLQNLDNGTEYYGHQIDNDDGDTYGVRLDPTHELCKGLLDLDFEYGNDIDTTMLVDSGNVVAGWSTVAGSTYPEKPTITAYAP